MPPTAHDIPFTDEALRLLADARSEAARLGHEYIGTEHVVLAITRQPPGTGPLSLLQIDPAAVRETLSTIVTPGNAAPAPWVELPFTSRTQKAFALAKESARELGHTHLGPEHIVLGLMRESVNLGAQVLGQSGVTAQGALEQVRRIGEGGRAT